MKLGDIKLQALKLMFVGYGEYVGISDLERLGSLEDYAAYLANMDGAINRCFSDLEHKRVLPVKEYLLQPSEGISGPSTVRFDLSARIPDLFDISRVTCETAYGYQGNLAFQCEGNVLILGPLDEDAVYRVLYYPKLRRVTPSMSDEDELLIPDEIAAFIPYFVKGELYREDEPNEAGEARNWYEAAMEQVTHRSVNRITHVHSVYSQV